MTRRTRSAQARLLLRRLILRLGALWILYTLAFALVAGAIETFAVPDFANWVADSTSRWITVDNPDAIELLYEEGAVERGAVEGGGLQIIYNESIGAYQVRDLGFYNLVRSMKVPLAAVLYCTGCVVLVLLELNRSLRYFDELSGAVAGLMSNRERPVVLSDELRIVQGELNAVREASLADERTAAASERRKNELVAYLAHDIKTPLTSVVGYLSLLDEAEDLPADTRVKYTRTALDKAERLEVLVDEFFEITRYNLQSIPVERATVGVRLFCDQVVEEFYPDAQARDVRITVDAPADETFYVDAEKLARALGNVLRNAVAYAEPETEVLLSASRLAGAAGWTLRVSNKGREISEAHLVSIFDKFYREDGSRGTRGGGAGLGLAIAREIVAAHGGTIAAQSENGVTVFTITLS